MPFRVLALPLSALIMLAGCQQGEGSSNAPGTSPQGYTGIAADEVITATGTEPFWNAKIAGSNLTYSTPENLDGTIIVVERFVGQGGIGFSGELGQRAFDLLVTPGQCSDGMSDRLYPYTVSLKIGDDLRTGCAFTDRQPYSELQTTTP
ncbi:COG3650 family protein [Qipengyuania sp. CAU 1752]